MRELQDFLIRTRLANTAPEAMAGEKEVGRGNPPEGGRENQQYKYRIEFKESNDSIEAGQRGPEAIASEVAVRTENRSEGGCED